MLRKTTHWPAHEPGQDALEEPPHRVIGRVQMLVDRRTDTTITCWAREIRRRVGAHLSVLPTTLRSSTSAPVSRNGISPRLHALDRILVDVLDRNLQPARGQRDRQRQPHMAAASHHADVVAKRPGQPSSLRPLPLSLAEVDSTGSTLDEPIDRIPFQARSPLHPPQLPRSASRG